MSARYAERHPTWSVIEASGPAGGRWCKAAAVNPAVAAAGAEIVVQADADCWSEGIADAVAAVAGGAGWAIPHQFVHRLSRDGTAAVLAGAAPAGQRLEQREYEGVAGGGILVARRETLVASPLDPRFVGWGGEDEAHAFALAALAGEPWRGKALLWHLWHPWQKRMTRRRGSRESWALRCRYAERKDDPAEMAALVEEGRRVDRGDDEAGHDPAPVGDGGDRRLRR